MQIVKVQFHQPAFGRLARYDKTYGVIISTVVVSSPRFVFFVGFVDLEIAERRVLDLLAQTFNAVHYLAISRARANFLSLL